MHALAIAFLTAAAAAIALSAAAELGARQSHSSWWPRMMLVAGVGTVSMIVLGTALSILTLT